MANVKRTLILNYVSTWNVRTLYKPAATKLLADQLIKYRADITALQEMRWLGEGVIEKREYNIYYSCDRKRHTFGTGFFVSKRVKHLVIDFNAVSDRICKLRLKGKFMNFSIINVHAPTEDSPEDEKDEWYEKLETVYNSCPSYDVKIVIGDMNAKIGKETVYAPTVGRHSLHEKCNDNGVKLVNFAMTNNMIIGGTQFPHKRIHKGTWTSPDGRVCNQIDHILIEGRYASNLMDVKTFRGADIDSDHFLVMSRIRSRISMAKTHKSHKAIKFDCDKLNNIEVKLNYQKQIRDKLMTSEMSESDVSDVIWGNIIKCVIGSAKEVLGEAKPEYRPKWFDAECETVTKKNEARSRLLQTGTRRATEEYKKRRRIEKQVHKQKKRRSECSEVKELNQLYARNESRKFYRRVNQQRKEFKPRNIAVRDKNGLIVNDKTDILARWTEHFDELLNSNNIQLAESSDNMLSEQIKDIVDDSADESTPPNLNDTLLALKSLKNNKSPGSDGIPSELLKYGGKQLYETVHMLITKIWTTEKMPEEWNLALICPLHKKGDALICSNYRGISLLNTCYKVLSSIIFSRLLPYAEKIVGEYQCGFRPTRSTTDQIFSLRQILEKMLEFNLPTHHIFIDFKAAYDSITRVKLLEALHDFGIPAKLVRLVRMTLSQTLNSVKVQNDIGKAFKTINGLRQGDALSCLLFNIALEKCVRNSQAQTSGTIFYKSTQLLGYADDLDLISRNVNILKDEYTRIKNSAEEMGLNVNQTKTKYMLASKFDVAEDKITFGDTILNKCSEFVYLGSLITRNNDVSAEIKRRIMVANRAFFSLKKHFRSHLLTRHIKISLYKALVRPIVAYGSECWTISKKDEEAIAVFERKVLRTIYGAIQVDGLWRIRYNHEIYSLFGEPNIVQYIKILRLQWAGHVQRMNDHRPPKKVMTSQPDGQRSIGRPKLRWIDGVERDAKTIGVANWRSCARDRDGWRNRLEQARAHKGL